MQKLRASLPAVADKFNVPLGSLANHMAHRLSAQGLNWWGAASNLQKGGEMPYEVAREFYFRRMDLNRLNSLDRAVLLRALEDKYLWQK